MQQNPQQLRVHMESWPEGPQGHTTTMSTTHTSFSPRTKSHYCSPSVWQTSRPSWCCHSVPQAVLRMRWLLFQPWHSLCLAHLSSLSVLLNVCDLRVRDKSSIWKEALFSPLVAVISLASPLILYRAAPRLCFMLQNKTEWMNRQGCWEQPPRCDDLIPRQLGGHWAAVAEPFQSQLNSLPLCFCYFLWACCILRT